VVATRSELDTRRPLRMVVHLHLLGPGDRTEAFDVATTAPMPADLDAPAEWWGALAVAGAVQLEAALRAGTRDFLPHEPDSGVQIVNVPFPPFVSIGPSLAPGEAVVIHTFTVDA